MSVCKYVDPASPGSPAMLVGPRQPRNRQTRQACTQTALAEKSLHQQAQPSQARHGMAYGIPKHKKTSKSGIFHKTPLYHHNSAAAPRGGTFYGWIIRARQSFLPPTLGFGAQAPFPKKTCRFCQSWGTTILQKTLKQNISTHISNWLMKPCAHPSPSTLYWIIHFVPSMVRYYGFEKHVFSYFPMISQWPCQYKIM